MDRAARGALVAGAPPKGRGVGGRTGYRERRCYRGLSTLARDLRPQLSEPVQHHVDPRPGLFGRQLGQEKPLAVTRDVVAARSGPPGAVGIRTTEQGSGRATPAVLQVDAQDRKSTRLNSSH